MNHRAEMPLIKQMEVMEMRYFGILDSNNKENKNVVGFVQLIKESEVINFVKSKIKENENDILETYDEEIIQELENRDVDLVMRSLSGLS